MKKMIRSEALEAALETDSVGPQEEEFQPEAFGKDFIFVLVLQISASGNPSGLITYLEELFIQTGNLGLEGAWTSLLGQR